MVEALRGSLSDHQRLLLRIHLGQADAIDAAVTEIDAELGSEAGLGCTANNRFPTPTTLIAAALSGTEVAVIRDLPSTAFVLCPPMLQICAFR